MSLSHCFILELQVIPFHFPPIGSTQQNTLGLSSHPPSSRRSSNRMQTYKRKTDSYLRSSASLESTCYTLLHSILTRSTCQSMGPRHWKWWPSQRCWRVASQKQHRQRVNRQNRIPSSFIIFIKPQSSESVSSRPINHDQPVFYALSTVLRVGTRGSLPNLCSILPLTTSQNSPDMWSKTPNFMVGNKLCTVKCTVGVLKQVQMFKLSMAHLFKSYFGILLRPTFPAGFSLDQHCIDI